MNSNHMQQLSPRLAQATSHFHKALLGSLFVIGLSACAVGPNYITPASTMPQTFAHAVPTKNATAGADSKAIDTWWTQFNDPLLTRIIERVLAQNLDLAAAMARVDQARAVAHLADANLLPAVSASAQAAAQHQSLQSPLGELARHQPGYDRNLNLYDYGVGASWEIDLFGGLRRGQEADNAEAQAAEAERLGVRVSVAAEAADAYLRVRGAQTRIALAEEQLRTDIGLLDLITLRLQQGMATRKDQAQAEARVSQVKATMPSLRAERDIQLNRLDVLMGVQPGTYAAELGAPQSAPTIPTLATLTPTLKPEDLLRRRPDVIAAERHLAASSARIGVATAEYYPKLSLSALLGFESLGRATPSSASFQPQAALGLRWRLFDFGRVDAEVARAKGANAEALARYRQAMLRATEDVENALVTQIRFEAEKHELSDEAKADLSARGSAEEAYQGGVSSLMEVLDQDRQVLATKDQLALAETGSARAVVATFRALGGGW